MSQDLNEALYHAEQDPSTQPYAEEIRMILQARAQGEITAEEAAYLLDEMAQVRLAQTVARDEIYVRWAVAAATLAAKLV